MMNLDLAALAEDAAYDLVVVGAGGAGMAAALFGALEGQTVLLVEHEAVVGGTTAWSGATTWIPGTQHAASVGSGPEDSAVAAEFMRRTVGNRSSEALRAAFLRNGPAAIARLEAETPVNFRARPLHPDYIQDVEGATLRGRALEPLPFDGRLLGEDLALVRPPIPEFTVLGGMMVDRDDIPHLLKMTKSAKSFVYSAKLLARYGMDRLRHSRGTRLLMGNALVGRLLYALKRKGVALLTRTKVERLLLGEGGIEGVALRQGDTRRVVRARKGVVMATGGFNRHPKRRAEMLHQPTPAYSPAAPGHTGELHDLALAAGARYAEGGLDNAFWAPCSVRKRPDGTTAVFPHFVLDRSKPGTLCVDQTGQRFVNESTSYHLFVRAMFEANRTRPTIPCFIVTDAEGLRRYGLGMVRPNASPKALAPFLADGYLTEAPTPEALAGKLGMDPAHLRDAVAAMNRYAQTGVDEEFGRGTTDYHKVNGDASRGFPNPTMGPIGTAPFYAVKLYPGDIGASTGMVTDADAQVLGPDDRPIGGLYAVGNDMQSIMGGVYNAPGITIGPGITFAYAAARHAAGRDGQASVAPARGKAA
ncbi:FAD-dependent oxidoreductase [Roseomonas sp. OT10]|uniref:FAD-dependent oxidoreductase n=1 Tax=Roseomonas cutis TaxID=2897332 RepID=UPI001E4F16F0|nr:FAD-dependent oxidoreductase [Roseomonas sp. OT10]UFN47685.1 FAD-dependent oxidoreductase [Roseomonas sp. OT10]